MEELEIVNLRNQIERKRVKFIEIYNQFTKIISSSDNITDLLLSSAIDLIVMTSKKMGLYNSDAQNSDINLYDEIINLNNGELYKIAEEAYMDGAISIIRYVIAQMFIRQEIASAQELQNKIEQLKKAFINKNIQVFKPYLNNHMESAVNFITNYDKTTPFQSWGPLYRYLLPFVYNLELRNSIWLAIEVIRDTILKDLNINDSWESKNSQGWYNKVRSYFGFEGPSNYGSQRAVLMLHPKNIPDHKNSVQLVCYFSEGKIFAGCDIGVNVNSNNLLIKFANWENIEDFDFNSCCNETSNYDQIKNNFSKIIQFLKNNLDFAQKNNEYLLKQEPRIGINETAEGNAEQGNGEDINLFDPYDNNDKSGFEYDKNKLKIKNAKYILSKKIAPNIGKDEDYLERKRIGQYLATEIISNKNIDPLNIGIYADWGSGKTQIFYFIKEFLNKKNKKFNLFNKKDQEDKAYICEIIDFDAWQYDDQEHIWANLIMKILDCCNKHPLFYFRYMLNKGHRYIIQHWQEMLLRIGVVFIVFVSIIYLNQLTSISIIEKIARYHVYIKIIIVLLIALSPDLLQFKSVSINKEFLNCFKLPLYKEQLGFKREIQELICFALTDLSNKGKKRIVLFIDNLDRCSHNNIKQILDSICQFLEMCNNPKANLIALFAMDKNIIKNALIKENIPEAKINEYLEKIINLPIYPQMPKEIDKLINRFFGEEENDVKVFLRNKYKNNPYNPRKLANIRYLDHMMYSVYGDFLKYDSQYVDLFELINGQRKDWEILSNAETKQKLENEVNDINKNNLDGNIVSVDTYKGIERNALLYVKNLYNYDVNMNIKINSSDNSKQSIILDGIVNLPDKDILLEVKYIRDIKSIKQIYKRAIQQLILGADILNSKKTIELMLIVVLDSTDQKQDILKDLNIELQKDLKLTKYSGVPIILINDEINN
mgnify:CR=1 FL=1